MISGDVYGCFPKLGQAIQVAEPRTISFLTIRKELGQNMDTGLPLKRSSDHFHAEFIQVLGLEILLIGQIGENPYEYTVATV